MSIVKGSEIATIDCVLVTIKPQTGDELGLDTASKVSVNVVTETEDAKKLIIKRRLVAQKRESITVTGNTIVLTDNVFNPELVQILQGGTIVYAQVYTHTAAGATPAGAYWMEVGTGKYITFTTAVALASSDTIVYNDVAGTLVVTKSAAPFNQTYLYVEVEPVTGTEVTAVASSDDTRVKSYAPPVSGSESDAESFELSAYTAIYNAAGLVIGYEKITYPNCTGVPIALSSEDGVFRVPEYTINSAPDTGEAPYLIEYVPRLPVVS